MRFCLLSLLTLSLVFVATVGCQSTADYASCGNGVRDEGEDCDGTQLDPSQDTCAEHGLWKGVVVCDEDCTLDVSDCSETPPCDPVAKTGCNVDLYCYLNSTASDLICAPEGAGALGATCSAAAYCERGLLCTLGFGNTCRQLFWETPDCSSGSCNNTLVTLPYKLGVCL